MAEQCLPSLFNKSAEDQHQDFPQVQEVEKRTKRVDSFSENKLHLSEEELNKETRKKDTRSQLKSGETISHKISIDVLGLLKKRKNDTFCSQLSRKKQESYRGQQHNETLKTEQKTHLNVVKQKASKFIHNEIQKESTLKFKSLTLKEKEAAIFPGENSDLSVQNLNMNAEEKEIVDSTDSVRPGTAIKVSKAMRIAREQSKSLLNNLYVEELLDDLILFNLLIEHKLTVQKLENIKETLVQQKGKEENKLNEITEKGKENGGFVIDYNVLFENEYELWIKRMEARALAESETRCEASSRKVNRVPGNVGRPTSWKGYYF